jgi:CRP/FNR family cyclic AMP-dependent transcriptional regulator
MSETATAPGGLRPGLERIALLSDLPPQVLDDLRQRCRWRRYAAGARIIERATPGRDVLFIVEGKVRVGHTTDEGREVTYGEIEAGGVVGELAAIDGGPRSAEVVAATDCRTASLSADAFRSLLLRHPETALRLLETYARIIRLADLRITELSTTGVAARLARELLRRAARDPGGELAVDPLPTQEQLAAVTGTTRETIGRVMIQLARTNLASRRGRRLVLLSQAGLAHLANMEENSLGSGEL